MWVLMQVHEGGECYVTGWSVLHTVKNSTPGIEGYSNTHPSIQECCFRAQCLMVVKCMSTAVASSLPVRFGISSHSISFGSHWRTPNRD
jgi:hypothetical protein